MGETQDGGLAEYCRAKAHQLVKIPDAIGFEQAAALPVAYGTAIRMMNAIGQIQGRREGADPRRFRRRRRLLRAVGQLAGAYVIACAGSEEKGSASPSSAPTRSSLHPSRLHEDGVRTPRQAASPALSSKAAASMSWSNFTGGDTWVKIAALP